MEMNPDYIIEKIKKGSYDNDKLIGWLKAMPPSKGNRRPIEFKIGDVFMHTIFKHPYVLLERKGDMWLCGLLTSDANCDEVLCEAKSRFFPENYFTRVLFTMGVPTGSFYGVYDNNRHLKSILNKLKKMMI